MKIRELLERTETKEKDQWGYMRQNVKETYSSYGRSREYNILMKYMDKDCVVAYLRERIGTVFIIRSAKKYFAFISLRQGIFYFGGYDYKLAPIEIKEARRIMGEDAIIVDEELNGRLSKQLIVDNL